MTLRCWPGCLAVIVGGRIGTFRGRIVEVVAAMGIMDGVFYWEVSAPWVAALALPINATPIIADADLRPILPPPAAREIEIEDEVAA